MDIRDDDVLPLGQFRQLKELAFTGTRVSKEVVEQLRSQLPDTQIQWETWQADRDAARWVLDVGGKVTILEEGTRTDIAKIDALPAHPFRVVGMDVRNHDGTTDADLARLKGLTALESLNLKGRGITDDGLVHLAGLTSLRELTLDAARVSGVGFAHLRELASLRTIWLGFGTAIDAEGFVQLGHLTNLRKLGLASGHVTDVGLQALARLTRLEELHLGLGAPSPNGLRPLTVLTRLRWLRLPQLHLTDAHLVPLGEIPSLQELILDGNTRVSDRGMTHLFGLTNLRKLAVRRTYVGRVGVELLRAKLPGCEVLYRTVPRPEEVLSPLTRAIEKDPDDPFAWRRRGHKHRQYQQWKEAASDYEQSLKLRKDLWLRPFAASLHLLTENEKAYREHRKYIVEHVGNAERNAEVWRRAIRACVLLPGSPEAFEPLLEGARNLAKADPDKWWTAYSPGIVLYRLGRHQEALAILQASQKLAEKPRHQSANLLWLALTYHQLGEKRRAAEHLDRAIQRMKSWYPHPDDLVGDAVFEEYVECTLLRHEA